MKFETKELVKWCIPLLEDYRVLNMREKKNFRTARSDKEIDNCEGSIKFLNSLPEIELHLCKLYYLPFSEGDATMTTTEVRKNDIHH